MFKAIGLAIAQAMAALSTLFGAAEKGARALDHLAAWSEETAGAFADESRVERQKKAALLKHQLEEQAKELAAAEKQGNKKAA